MNKEHNQLKNRNKNKNENINPNENDNEKTLVLKDCGKYIKELHDNQRVFEHKVKSLPFLNTCSYNKGYVTQMVSICLTCNEDSKNSKQAGICPGCAVNCHHESHEIIEIGYRRGFRCDCGNSNFHQSCDYDL